MTKRLKSPMARFNAVRKSTVPEGGWTQKTFTSPQGLAMMRDMVTIQRLEQGKGVKRLTKSLDGIFKSIFRDIVAGMEKGVTKGAQYVDIDLGIMTPNEVGIWTDVIDRVLKEHEEPMRLAVRNSAQSVADGVFGKTAMLLGYSPTASPKVQLVRDVNSLANDVTNINATTRARLQRTLYNGLNKGVTVRDMIKQIKEKAPAIAKGRIPTIARTEMGRAADAGRKLSIAQSGVVTHVSVVGCEAIEPNSPTYGGRHTCNIQNVPVSDIDLLVFHPNHTGTIIPSRFVDDTTPAPSVDNRQPVKERQDRPSYEPPELHPNEAAEIPIPRPTPPPAATTPPIQPAPVAPVPAVVPPVKPPKPAPTPATTPATTPTLPGESDLPPFESWGNESYDELRQRFNTNKTGFFPYVSSDEIDNFLNSTDGRGLTRDTATAKIYEKKTREFVEKTGYYPDTFTKAMCPLEGLRDENQVTFGKNKIILRVDTVDGVVLRREMDLNTNEVSHEYLKLPKSAQSNGTAKKLLRSQVGVYRKMGLDKINVHANIDVGGYAWARFGFIPDKRKYLSSFQSLRSDIAYRAEKILNSPDKWMVITEHERAMLDKLVEQKWNEAEFIREIAALKGRNSNGLTMGKELLLGSDWYGVIDLKDAASANMLDAYINP